MNRKHFFFSFFIVFTLSSCDFPYRPIYPLDSENTVFNYQDLSLSYKCSTIQGELPSNLTLVNSSLFSTYFSSGLVLVSSPLSGKLGAYSLLTKSLVASPIYDEIQPIPTDFNGFYLKAIKELSGNSYSFDVFDPLGYEVLSSGYGDDTSGDDFSLATLKMKDDYRQVINVEMVNHSGKTSFYKVNSDRSRGVYFPKSYFLHSSSSGYLPCRSSAFAIGLEGYELSMSSQQTLFLWKDGQLITDFHYPTGFDVQGAFWKSFFGQRIDQTTSDNYDFVKEGKRYKLTTERLEIINGEYFPVSFSYFLEDLAPLYDDSGVAHYALAEVKKIQNHTLAEQTSRFVIDNHGRVRADVSEDPRYEMDVQKISPAFFFGRTKNEIYNTDFQAVASMPNNISTIDPAEEQMLFQNNGHYGVVSFDGNILLSPVYDSVTLLPQIQWHALGMRNGKYYLINPAGKEEKELTYPKNYSDAVDTTCGYVEVTIPIANDENLSWVGHSYVSYNGDYDYSYVNYEQIGERTLTLFNLKAYCSLFRDLQSANRILSLAYLVE